MVGLLPEEEFEFVVPEFLDKNEEYFYNLAMSLAPGGVDTSEGQMYHDHVMPTVLIAAELTEFVLPIAIKKKFPQFAGGEDLDLLGEPINVLRRSPTYATGPIYIASKNEGASIPAGTKFYTLGSDLEVTKEYELMENVKIDNGGAYGRVRATTSGVEGNVPVNSIVSIERGYEIDSVTNVDAITGGVDAEDDETYRRRIIDKSRNKELSGARRDYIRWAQEVDGVGSVIVQPLWAGPQTVRVLITDSNNQLATQELIQKVKEYIDPYEYEGKGEGKAPIGAIVTVDTIEAVTIDISFVLFLEEGYEKDIVIDRIKNNINRYFIKNQIVRMSEVGAVIIETQGVLDYENLKLDGQEENITLQEGQRAVVGEVTVIEQSR